jgi:single-stranded DNA-binding protein
MAKENFVWLRGQIRREPVVIRNKEEKPIGVVFTIYTINRDVTDRTGHLAPKFDKPVVMIEDPLLVKKALTIKNHDIVELKGVFRTGTSVRKKICPCCNAENHVQVTTQVITPSYIGIVKTGLTSDSEGLNELIDTAEISNFAKIIGRVCTPTDKIHYGTTERNDIFTRYQLAVNRKMYIAGSDGYDDHTDYPWIISYGKQAYNDHIALQQGSLVYLDGFVHTMLMKVHAKCTECGEDFTFESQRMMLTPFSVEYLQNCNNSDIDQTRENKDEEDNTTPDHDRGMDCSIE